MAHPRCKVYYWDGRGRAELCRMMFAEKKVDFDDVRFEDEDWPKIKPTTPFGQAPFMDIGNVRIAQSAAMDRYVATTVGLYGKNPLEAARIDMVVEGLLEIVQLYSKARYTEDPDAKNAALGNFFSKELVRFTTAFERILKQNQEGKGYFVGDDVTYADIFLFRMYNEFELSNQQPPATTLREVPLLKALYDRVATRPNIARHVQQRKPTDF